MSVVGTRPNFMKIAPIAAALETRKARFSHTLVHTGQHYDDAMSHVFFDQLGVGRPEHNLGVGSGPHGAQTAKVMSRLEPILVDQRPDVLLVPGDVNSTLGAAIVASKLGIVVAHVEAGLRSFDRTMPEEVNRVLTDAVSDLLFIHSPEARDHLLAEGRPAEAIHAVGNTMIDTLIAMHPSIEQAASAVSLGLSEGKYLVVTLHRPALTDGDALVETMAALEAVAESLPVVFPVHPRTRARMEERGIHVRNANFRIIEPLGYVEFMSLLSTSAGVLTDSGGIQEETTYLKIPCFTLRDNTERPITITNGTNVLLGLAPSRIREVPQLLASRAAATGDAPDGWDGHASERILQVLEQTVDIVTA